MGKLLVAFVCVALLGLPAQAHAIESLSPEMVLLKRGDIAVTVDDLNRYIADRVPPQRRAQVLEQPGFIKSSLENIFIIKYLSAKGEATPGVDIDQIEWSAKMHRDRGLMDAYLEKQVEHAEKTIDWEAAAKEIYQAEPEKFLTDEQVRAMHILVSTNGRTPEEARRLAETYRDKVLAGEDFAELAARHSDDPSAVNNRGELGFFGRGRMVKEFEDAVFAMSAPGLLNEPVKSQYGYHVIKLLEKRPAGRKPFESVKGQIIRNYRAKIGSQAREDVVTGARNVTDIFVDEDRVAQIEEMLKKSTGASERAAPSRRSAVE